MRIAVIGNGFVGNTLGTALGKAGHVVTMGARNPSSASGATPQVAAIADALRDAEIIILAVPGAAVGELARDHAEALANRLVIDATNQMGAPVSNARSVLPASVRYARAFNTTSGENMADPMFPGGQADMFFSAPEADRDPVEEVVSSVGFRPVYVGADKEALLDAMFQLWVQLAMVQGRGRRVAFHLLEAN